MDPTREMTLKEWCDELPGFHLVNKEKLKLAKAIALLNSMLCSGEAHSDKSRQVVSEALAIL